jgi:hypothetical protein
VKHVDIVMGNLSERPVELGVRMESSEVAVTCIRTEKPELGIDAGDATRQSYSDEQFDEQ